MKLAYLDCYSGISGDMLLGGLIACGADPAAIEGPLQALGLGDLRLRQEQVRRGSLMGTQVKFEAPPQKGHRHYTAIAKMLQQAPLSPRVRDQALAVFRRLGEVEAALHGCSLEHVHFHEVGAVDSIADIVGNCLALELLGIDEIHCSPLNLGSGTVQCDHGVLPVPAPATVALLKGLPVYSSGVRTELVTPTGAALVSTLARNFGPLPEMHIVAAGYGAGARDLAEMPNLLRVIIGEREQTSQGLERLLLLEANLDDMNPQLCGYFSERAFAAGALDVFFAPVQMKKNRPGLLLSVLCRPEQRETMMNLFFQETTTLGVRYSEVLRRALAREWVEVATRYGPVRVKVARENGHLLNFSPEFEDARRVALENNVPLKDVLAETALEFERRRGGSSS